MRDSFDVFFSYHWRDHAAVERIARALIERGLSVFLDRWYLAPGQPWPQALESALARCRAVAIFLGAEGLGPWQQRERDLALDRQGREPGFPVIPVLLSAIADPALGFLKLNTWVDLSAGVTDEVALETLTAAIRRQPPWPLALQQIEAVRAEICPYRGLRPFREEDEPFFFGRAMFIETLAAMLAHQPFIAVVGASGSGKSSVVRAGLIPRLRRGEGRLVWDIVTLVPTHRPLLSLAAALLPLLEPDLSEVDRLKEVGELATYLNEDSVALRDIAARVLKKQPGTDRLLLFIDQWEELYTLCPDEQIRRTFAAHLLEAAAGPVRVVMTMRGDFFGRALADRALSDQLQDAVVNIGPMARGELAETVVKPAEAVGLAFEAGLAETILDDVGDEPGGLPLLEFLLEALWKERRGALLHYDAYHRLGRVPGAIAHRADDVFTRELDDNQRQAAQRLLIRMVRPGEGVEDMRQRATMPADDPVAEATIRKLADARLVVTGRDSVSSRETVEIAHEALIRSWQRLRGWVEQDREFLRTRERVAAEARFWEDEGRPTDRLLPAGRRLAQGEDLIENRRPDLEPQVIDYIEFSVAAAQAEQETQGKLGRLFDFFGLAEARDHVEKRRKTTIELENQIRELEKRERAMKQELIQKEKNLDILRGEAEELVPLVFLSYAKEDISFVMRLHTHLKDNGFRTWLDKENILPGQKWRNVIQKAIVAANFLVFCISRSSVNKRGFVHVEQKWALEIADHIPEEQIYLIPARIEECSVPFSLAQYQYIDLYVEDGLDRLTKAITIEWAKRKGFIVPAAYP